MIGELNKISSAIWIIYILLCVVIITTHIILCIKFGKHISLTTLLIVIYAIFILLATLLTRKPGPEMKYALTPFWSWVEVIENNRYKLLLQIKLNILMFVPFGILFGIRKSSAIRTCLFALSLSAAIEVLQLLFHLGLFEWDDMIHNTVGCMLGFISMTAVMKIWRKCLTL